MKRGGGGVGKPLGIAVLKRKRPKQQPAGSRWRAFPWQGLWQSVHFDCFDGSPKSLRPTERSRSKPRDLTVVRHFPPAHDIADNALRAVIGQIKGQLDETAPEMY